MQRPEFCRSHDREDWVQYYLDLVEYWLEQHDDPLAAANAASYARIAARLEADHP